jgi:AcrR family transcriptional regulator
MAAAAEAPAAGRRARYAASTRRSLVEVAELLFTEHGYAATSLDAIVTAAEVTKGALYHHYSGKQALFEAVFDRVESAGAQQLEAALEDHRDPWDRTVAALGAFLDVVRQPAYSRVVIQDGPSVLGYQRFCERQERSTFACVLAIVRSVLHPDERMADRADDEAMEHTIARLFFGAMSSAGATVSRADDADQEAERVGHAVGLVIAGLRALSERGGAAVGVPTS